MDRHRHIIVRTTTGSAGAGCHGGCGFLAHIKEGRKMARTSLCETLYANCIQYGRLESLSPALGRKPRLVLGSPR